MPPVSGGFAGHSGAARAAGPARQLAKLVFSMPSEAFTCPVSVNPVIVMVTSDPTLKLRVVSGYKEEKLDHMTAFGEREKGSVRKAAKKTSIGGHSV